MSHKERNGVRKSRKERKQYRPKLGYYSIFTDTEATEKNYFEGLQDSLPDEIKDNIIIKVYKTDTKKLVEDCLYEVNKDPRYRRPWIVFDRDQVVNFDNIISEAERRGINVGWSNPCFEIWLFAYFTNIPSIAESWNCCSKFGEIYKKYTGKDYKKSDKDLYKMLIMHGNEKKAIQKADNRLKQHKDGCIKFPSDMVPATTVQNLIKEITGKI